ncbi:MAG: hypothetical protein GC185_01760 [Alphaproteobacteria bacterium]|nr:hypothetical protein [Alphaproteobacteria bacterium]
MKVVPIKTAETIPFTPVFPDTYGYTLCTIEGYPEVYIAACTVFDDKRLCFCIPAKCIPDMILALQRCLERAPPVKKGEMN